MDTKAAKAFAVINTSGTSSKVKRINITLGSHRARRTFSVSSDSTKIAKPLGFEEHELFMLAGFLFQQSSAIAENDPLYGGRRLDPYVTKVLAQEPVEMQRGVIGLLSILRSLAKKH